MYTQRKRREAKGKVESACSRWDFRVSGKTQEIEKGKVSKFWPKKVCALRRARRRILRGKKHTYGIDATYKMKTIFCIKGSEKEKRNKLKGEERARFSRLLEQKTMRTYCPSLRGSAAINKREKK